MEQLGLNWQGLVTQIVNFGILMLLLWMVLYKPVVKMLDARAEKIRQGLQYADEMKVALERAQEQSAALVEQGRKEGQAIVARAEQIASRIREEAQAQAKEEADQFLQRARAEIEMDKQRAVAELREQVADLAILAAGRVVGQSLDNTAQFRIIKEVLDEASLKR